MIEGSSKDWLFVKNNPINLLILDAQVTFNHHNVRRYASKVVWEAVQMKMEREEKRDEYLACEAERFKSLALVKRKFGEKKKTNKKRQQMSGLALANRRHSLEDVQTKTVPSPCVMTSRRPIRVIRNDEIV